MNSEAHEAWRKWCEHAVENKWQDLSQGADALAACYLDAMARLDKAERERDEAKTLLRSVVAGDDDYSTGCDCKRCAAIRAFLERESSG